MEEAVSANEVTKLRGRASELPSWVKAACNEIEAAVDHPGVGETAATVQRMIMRYYEDVRGQATDSFTSANRVASVGFVVLILTVMYVVSIDLASHIKFNWFQPAKEGMNVGAIGLTSGAVVEAIAGMQFWLYSRAARQFGAFHICLERTHRYLLAYKMAEQIQNDRGRTLEKIVCIMANAPMITRADIEGVESGQLLANLRQAEDGKMVAGAPAVGEVLPTAAAS